MNAQTPLITESITAAISAKEPKVDLIGPDAPFDPAQRDFLNGLLAGLSAIAAGAAQGEEVLTPMRVLYGSQSGNCEVLSKDLKKAGAGHGFVQIDGAGYRFLSRVHPIQSLCCGARKFSFCKRLRCDRTTRDH